MSRYTGSCSLEKTQECVQMAILHPVVDQTMTLQPCHSLVPGQSCFLRS